MCLDDFGSGYANLNAVLRIPFSAVKMDRSLLSGVSSDPQTATFYRSIVMILQHMGYKVIAEGAETEKEVKLLEKWGVDMIQGYYFSRPLCEEKLLDAYLETGTVEEDEIRRLIQKRKLFPCFSGSALKLQGVKELLDGFCRLSKLPCYPEDFGARIYKISRDGQGNRLSHLKVTGGNPEK